jgi:hypothetical protein
MIPSAAPEPGGFDAAARDKRDAPCLAVKIFVYVDYSEDAMREFSTVELLRDLKTVTHAAAREPVAITQHRKPRFVLMALEDFERMKAGNPDPRKVYRIEETPPELAGLLADGLDRIIAGEDAADGA